jgi:hypothetical protein
MTTEQPESGKDTFKFVLSLVQVIVVPLMLWMATSMSTMSQGIARQEERTTTLVGQVHDLQTTVAAVQDDRYRRSEAQVDKQAENDRLRAIETRVATLEDSHAHK